MPKLAHIPPKISRQKSNNSAVVYINGRTIYLGKWGSEETLKEYSRILYEWTNADSVEKDILFTQGDKTTADLAVAFLKHHEGKMDKRDYERCTTALKLLCTIYPNTPIKEFNVRSLINVQELIEKTGRFSRDYCNRLINWIRRVFRWGLIDSMVTSDLVYALEAVPPLREGYSTAHETEPRLDIADEIVKRTLPYLTPTIAAMVVTQRLAVMRPSEVCNMKVGEINTTGEVWLYVPKKHKGSWRKHKKVVTLGKPEQKIIAPRLLNKSPDDAVFSPRDTMNEIKLQKAQNRKTKITPSQQKRNEYRSQHPKRITNNHYKEAAYGRAIKKTIERVNRTLPNDQKLPLWTPYQLRHTGITDITEIDGLDAARAVAGQKTINVAHIYNHADLKISIKKAKERKDDFNY